MNTWFCSVFITLYYFVTLKSSYQTLLKIATKKLSVQRLEDYSFESVLNRAKEECSYMTLINSTVNRNKTLQLIKERLNNKRLREFYEQKEKEKQRGKEYYENVERQSRRRFLELNGKDPGRKSNYIPPRILPKTPRPHLRRTLYKRSAVLNGRRRKTSPSFSEVSFIDYNNCSSRCIFARMEILDSLGFPNQSLMSKLIDDRIVNRKLRLDRMKKVGSCFRKMEEVALEDSCIYSTRLFECLDLEEEFLWSIN